MSEPKFTKGPWHFDCDCIKDGSGHTSDASDIAYMNMDKENWGDEYDGDWKANANLIAASPDLFASCEELIQWCNGYDKAFSSQHGLPAIVERAEAALAKAQGKEQ